MKSSIIRSQWPSSLHREVVTVPGMKSCRASQTFAGLRIIWGLIKTQATCSRSQRVRFSRSSVGRRFCFLKFPGDADAASSQITLWVPLLWLLAVPEATRLGIPGWPGLGASPTHFYQKQELSVSAQLVLEWDFIRVQVSALKMLDNHFSRWSQNLGLCKLKVEKE